MGRTVRDSNPCDPTLTSLSGHIPVGHQWSTLATVPLTVSIPNLPESVNERTLPCLVQSFAYGMSL